MMKINYILPFYPRFPIGGHKVQYEYANCLAQRGHQVRVIYSRTLEPASSPIKKLKGYLWRYVKPLQNGGIVPWFAFHPNVRLLLIPDLREKFIPHADVTVATCWSVVDMVRQYSPSKGRQFYVVYDYEIWRTATEEIRQKMRAAFKADLGKIATSPAVKEMLAENDTAPVAYIPCGINFEKCGVDLPIEQRLWGTIGFPARLSPDKGMADGIEALNILKARYGDRLRIKAFGPQPVPNLPNWVDFTCLPTDEQLKAFYNSISIFIFPSHYEGWGLPGTEALACGAALVASDSIGLRDYAIDGETALLVSIKRSDLLANAVEKLLSDDTLRQQLAYQGNNHVQQYTWECAVNSLEKLFHR